MQITNSRLAELIEQASQTGARQALSQLGLADDSAAKDMADLRELLAAWRDAKKSVRTAAIEWLVRGGLALFAIAATIKLGLIELVLK
ncbi:MAG: DUF6127 family protein [Sphingorhabdus sp.]